jgi:chromosome segregation ATPase
MADVQTLHNALKDLLSQITPLRQEAAELQEGLDRVKRDYEPRLGELNDRREELETLMQGNRRPRPSGNHP